MELCVPFFFLSFFRSQNLLFYRDNAPGNYETDCSEIVLKKVICTCNIKTKLRQTLPWQLGAIAVTCSACKGTAQVTL